MNNSRETTYKYIINTSIGNYYCKISDFKFFKNINFGSRDTYCFSGSYTDSTKTLHIGYVKNDNTCFHDYDNKKSKDLVKAALWTIKELYPEIKKITFEDDSKIECKYEDITHKLSLIGDYIFKYNKTWYEYHFGATLPNTYPDFEYDKYKNTLKVLDEPIKTHNSDINTLHYLEKYKSIYLNSSTPRIFIKNLRNKYGKDYCREASYWLAMYMTFLDIQLFKDDWIIPVSSLKKPDNYTISKTNVSMKGGKKNKSFNKKNKTKKLLNKTRHKIKRYSKTRKVSTL